MIKWQKDSISHFLADGRMTLWARESGESWDLVYRAGIYGWITLGTYQTLTEAQCEGLAIMGVTA